MHAALTSAQNIPDIHGTQVDLHLFNNRMPTWLVHAPPHSFLNDHDLVDRHVRNVLDRIRIFGFPRAVVFKGAKVSVAIVFLKRWTTKSSSV